jgi:hypothetical protein
MTAGFSTEQALEVIAIVAAPTITNYTASVTKPLVEQSFQAYSWSAYVALQGHAQLQRDENSPGFHALFDIERRMLCSYVGSISEVSCAGWGRARIIGESKTALTLISSNVSVDLLQHLESPEASFVPQP